MSPLEKARQRLLQKRRSDAFREARRKVKVDSLLVTRPVDVAYLSGFRGEDSCLLYGNGFTILVTDFRFAEQAPLECPGVDVHVRSPLQPMEAALASLIKKRDVKRTGIQAHHMTVAQRATLGRKLRGRRLMPLADVIMGLRVVKSDEEIRLTRKAVMIAERAFQDLIAQGAEHFAGKTERQIAAELENRMRMLGADKAAFEIIVGAGANSSICHYRPGDRRIRRGDAVLIDWGAEVQGYRSDTTRVVFVGAVPDGFAKIYHIVLDAHECAAAAIRPGNKCANVDRVARELIAGAGHGEHFGHSVGHGIGREIHELPRLSRLNNGAVLRKNMIVTIEPGIYIPGQGGVRIEDDYLVTADGCERLNRLPRALDRMVLR
jgi:Xaa-Pro aminopeptidase